MIKPKLTRDVYNTSNQEITRNKPLQTPNEIKLVWKPLEKLEPTYNHKPHYKFEHTMNPRIEPWLLIPIVIYSNIRTWMVMWFRMIRDVFSSKMLEREWDERSGSLVCENLWKVRLQMKVQPFPMGGKGYLYLQHKRLLKKAVERADSGWRPDPSPQILTKSKLP